MCEYVTFNRQIVKLNLVGVFKVKSKKKKIRKSAKEYYVRMRISIITTYENDDHNDEDEYDHGTWSGSLNSSL